MLPFIDLQGISHTYMLGSPFENLALKNVSLQIFSAERVGIIGSTGSGKSTLVQHFNGLLLPTSGQVIVDGLHINGDTSGADLAKVRFKVGMLFQFPEQQLFEETIFDDVAFGPKNMGLNEQEIEERVLESLELVGLANKDFRKLSPFALSGGEKRRVALAGVLSVRPECLVLDEPTAGLDPKSSREILEVLLSLNEREKITIIMISHRFEDMALWCQRAVVMNKGEIVFDGSFRDVVYREDLLNEVGLRIPDICKLALNLQSKGVLAKEDRPITVEEFVKKLT